MQLFFSRYNVLIPIPVGIPWDPWNPGLSHSGCTSLLLMHSRQSAGWPFGVIGSRSHARAVTADHHYVGPARIPFLLLKSAAGIQRRLSLQTRPRIVPQRTVIVRPDPHTKRS